MDIISIIYLSILTAKTVYISSLILVFFTILKPIDINAFSGSSEPIRMDIGGPSITRSSFSYSRHNKCPPVFSTSNIFESAFVRVVTLLERE